jgi:hypothetical protein
MAITVLKNTPIHCVVAVSGTSATETINLDSTILYGTIKTFDGSSSSVVSVANDTLTISNHGFATGDRVVYSDGGGDVVDGLTDEATYYIVVVDGNTVKLATTYDHATAAIPTIVNITDVGTGSAHKLYKGQFGVSPVVNITGITWSVGAADETATVTRNSAVLWALNGSNDFHFSGWTDNRQNTSDIVVVTPAGGATVVIEMTKVSGYADSQHLNQNVN